MSICLIFQFSGFSQPINGAVNMGKKKSDKRLRSKDGIKRLIENLMDNSPFSFDIKKLTAKFMQGTVQLVQCPKSMPFFILLKTK